MCCCYRETSASTSSPWYALILLHSISLYITYVPSGLHTVWPWPVAAQPSSAAVWPWPVAARSSFVAAWLCLVTMWPWTCRIHKKHYWCGQVEFCDNKVLKWYKHELSVYLLVCVIWADLKIKVTAEPMSRAYNQECIDITNVEGYKATRLEQILKIQNSSDYRPGCLLHKCYTTGTCSCSA